VLRTEEEEAGEREREDRTECGNWRLAEE